MANNRRRRFSWRPRWAAAAAALVLAAPAMAGEIGYISSAGGYMLHASGNQAVTAKWSGQAPLSGFTGYGNVRLGNSCLTTNGPAGKQLTWESCRGGDKAQVWALSGSKLNNELGWCADVEGNRAGAGVRVIAWQCSGAANQKWKSHEIVPASSVASRIADPKARNTFVQNAASAAPGRLIDLRSGALINLDGGTLQRAAGNVMITAGSGKLVSDAGMR